MEYLRWFLVGGGLIYLLTEATIMTAYRVVMSRASVFARSFAYCRACTGFWVGFLLGLLGYWPTESATAPIVESALAMMFVGAVWSAIFENGAWHAEAALHGGIPIPYPKEEAPDDEEETR